jgi:hypothetical protein
MHTECDQETEVKQSIPRMPYAAEVATGDKLRV